MAPAGRKMRQNAFDQIAVRIQERQPTARFQIIPDQSFQERGLPCPGLADEIHMSTAVCLLDAESDFLIPVVSPGKEVDVVIGGWRNRHEECLLKKSFSHYTSSKRAQAAGRNRLLS